MKLGFSVFTMCFSLVSKTIQEMHARRQHSSFAKSVVEWVDKEFICCGFRKRGQGDVELMNMKEALLLLSSNTDIDPEIRSQLQRIVQDGTVVAQEQASSFSDANVGQTYPPSGRAAKERDNRRSEGRVNQQPEPEPEPEPEQEIGRSRASSLQREGSDDEPSFDGDRNTMLFQ